MSDFRHMAEKDELRREIAALRLENERLRKALDADTLMPLVEEVVASELDHALAYTDGGAPSDKKDRELTDAVAEARKALRAALEAKP